MDNMTRSYLPDVESQEISEMPTYTNKDDVNDGCFFYRCVSCQQLV